MSSDGKSNFGSTKWVVIIALGVVFGLLLWTTGNIFLAEWQKNRREQEAAQEKAESDRESGEDARRRHAWSEIIFDAQLGEKARNMIGGTAPLRRDGTLRSRIESSPEYKRRLGEIGAGAMRKSC